MRRAAFSRDDGPRQCVSIGNSLKFPKEGSAAITIYRKGRGDSVVICTGSSRFFEVPCTDAQIQRHIA